jgi:hypothetical protein
VPGNWGNRRTFDKRGTTIPRPLAREKLLGKGIALDFPGFHRLYDDDWIVLFF